MSNTTISSNSISGTVSAGAISGMTLTSNSGSITASGAGTITNFHVHKNNSGTIWAKEDQSKGSGVISGSTIGANSGNIFAGSIFGMKVGHNAHCGIIKAAGQGTTDDLSVGSNSGSIVAAEDSIAGMAESGTGVMSNTTISSNSNSGTVSAGAISGMTLTSNSGSITASGAGTITNFHVHKNNSGTIWAKEDQSKGSGVISGSTIGANSGNIFAGSIFGMKVGHNARCGIIKAAGQGTTDDLSVGSNWARSSRPRIASRGWPSRGRG